jgi:hypothetical protein
MDGLARRIGWGGVVVAVVGIVAVFAQSLFLAALVATSGAGATVATALYGLVTEFAPPIGAIMIGSVGIIQRVTGVQSPYPWQRYLSGAIVAGAAGVLCGPLIGIFGIRYQSTRSGQVPEWLSSVDHLTGAFVIPLAASLAVTALVVKLASASREQVIS